MTVSGMSRTINFQPPPVFNKRLFKAQAGIVLTEEILHILRAGPRKDQRSMTDLNKLKSVVNGLKDIHKGLQYIKDALAYVITYEKVESGKTVTKKRNEKMLSCYYILNGSVEAKYLIDLDDNDHSRGGDVRGDLTREKPAQENGNSAEINYTHVAGDYLGLVSADGPQYDLPPPDSMCSMEVCEFLRIDRGKFHQAIKMVQKRHVREIEHFIDNSEILNKLPAEERANLVPLMAKQEYPAGKVIINQGDIPEHIFFVGKGRCQYFRRVYIGEARRLELVRLGQIERGGFFGESSLLSNSPCFCSVTSIGPVTCYLVNKWAIKTNEHILARLRDNQHFFHEDDIIKHFIRDSDIWQSYKRSKIVELLDGTDKQHVVVGREHVSDSLSTAVDFGDAMRRHSNIQEREPGEPKKEEPLFIPPRSRRRSSAILHSNAAAVVKAVLLLRRNVTESVELHVPARMEPPAPSPIRLPQVRDAQKAKRKRIKPSSAPGRYRTFPSPVAKSPTSPPLGFRSRGHTSTTGAGGENKDRRPAGIDSRPSEKTTARKHTRKSKSADFRVRKKKGKDLQRPGASPEQENEEPHSPSPTLATEKVTSNRNFIVKEVINTGVPGKRALSPSGFKRFEKSMFQLLDQPKPEAETLQFGPSPWGMAFAANKWMSSVRKKRARLRNASDRNSPSPTTPPIIVIEEYAPASDSSVDGVEGPVLDDPDTRSCSSPVSSTKRVVSRTPSPALEELKEENDEEISEYERHEAGKAVEEKWYTPIHEARDQSRSHLQKVKEQLEIIKKERDVMRRQHRLGSAAEEQVAADQQESETSAHDQKSESAEHETDTEESQSSRSSATKQSILRHGKYSSSRRQRSRTFSSGHGSEADSTARRRSLGPSHVTGHVLRTESLSCFRRTPIKTDEEPRTEHVISVTEGPSNPAMLYSYRMMNSDDQQGDYRKTILTRNEKRRLLLLGKLGLR